MKTIHKAKHVSNSGQVSAQCFKKLRAIDLNRSLWTLSDQRVTCRKCKKLLEQNEHG